MTGIIAKEDPENSISELEYDYDPAGGDASSAEPGQLAACLRAGQVPDAYAHAIESAEVVEKRVFVRSSADTPVAGSVEEMRGLEKVNAEFALMAMGYNLARAMSLLGFGGLMEAVRG